MYQQFADGSLNLLLNKLTQTCHTKGTTKTANGMLTSSIATHNGSGADTLSKLPLMFGAISVHFKGIV
jgi:hypothetical protein